MTQLHWNDAWRCTVGEVAVLDGGADARFVLDNVDSADVAGVLAAIDDTGTLQACDLPPARSAVVDLFVKAGALAPRTIASPAGAATVVPAGPGSSVFAAELSGLLSGVGGAVVVARCGDTLEALNTMTAPAETHLLVDVAYRSRIVVGPLVLPGLTACVSCYAGRVAYRWGDEQPPPTPAASTRIALIAELVRLELERAAAGASTLTNRCVVFDTGDLTTKSEHVYKLPWCPHCTAPAANTPSEVLSW
jgi:bacteriocin biosynthesis cyclodehydratase domain-containing protein